MTHRRILFRAKDALRRQNLDRNFCFRVVSYVGVKMGWTTVIGLEGGKSKQLYKCQAVNCTVTPRGTDLAQHYINQTDWDLVAELMRTLSEDKVKRLCSEADPHTLYIYQKGYSRTKLPSWSTHVMVRKQPAASDGGAGQQSLLSSYFKVGFCDC